MAKRFARVITFGAEDLILPPSIDYEVLARTRILSLRMDHVPFYHYWMYEI